MFRFWRKQTVNIDTQFIDEEINRSRRFEHPFGLLIIEVGQTEAKGLAKLIPGNTISYQVLKSHLRIYDKVIGPFIRRYCVLIPETTREGLLATKDRLQALISEYASGSVDIGQALYPEDGETAQQLIKKAMRL